MEKEVKIYQSDNPLVMALQGTPMKVAADADIAATLDKNLTEARFYLGYKEIDDDTYEKFIDALFADIKTFWYTLTLEEVPFVFDRGRRGKYDEKVFLTPAVVSSWFSKFLTSRERLDAKQQLEDLKRPKPRPLTEEERKQKTFDMIAEAYESYKSDSKHEASEIVYDAIEAFRLVPFDAEEKKTIAEQAKELIIKKSKPGVSIREQMQHKEYTEAVKAGNQPFYKQMIRREAKKIALKKFFNQLAEQDIDVISWLKGEID